jgi:coenzyme F420-reducing hydrogenase delta subunit
MGGIAMDDQPKIVAFCCEHSGELATRMASDGNDPTPDNVRIVSVPCSGNVQVMDVLDALRVGADGVVVFGCHDGSCKHLAGNKRARKRVEYIAGLLKEIGWGPERVSFIPVSAAEGRVLLDRLAEVEGKLRGLTVEA